MSTKKETILFKKFGQRVKALRLKIGRTQEQMSEHGFSIRFYQRIEAGKPVHLRTVFKLAEAFGVKTGEFFKE